MKVLFINERCGHTSTGKICAELAEEYDRAGHEVYIAYGRDSYVPERYQKYAIRIGNDVTVRLNVLRTRLLDDHGFGLRRTTEQFLTWLDAYQPDLIWLHNLHGYYINVELLFQWLKKHPEVQIKWTLHDCWAFTGHCAYFTAVGCDKWKNQCLDCPQLSCYPKSWYRDNSAWNYNKKRELFTGFSNLSIITPSKWLEQLVKKSFLKEYPVEVRYNTINYEMFKPTESNLQQRYGIQDKIVLLGVASVWEPRKGLEDLLQLATLLDDSYVLMLVGVDKKQIQRMWKEFRADTTRCLLKTGETIIENNVTVNNLEKDKAELHVKREYIENLKRRNGCGLAIPVGVSPLYEMLTGQKTKQVPKKTMNLSKIICIPKTNSMEELAQIYTVADVFINPTHEENYPTVNLEAIACGTFVVTYDVGGCRETLVNCEV